MRNVQQSQGYSADAAPRVPTLKLSMYRTVWLSSGTIVPPDYQHNMQPPFHVYNWLTSYNSLTEQKYRSFQMHGQANHSHLAWYKGIKSNTSKLDIKDSLRYYNTKKT